MAINLMSVLAPPWYKVSYRLGRCQYNVTGRDKVHGLRAASVWTACKICQTGAKV